MVALRKESVDRNLAGGHFVNLGQKSLSARRAWIEIYTSATVNLVPCVALRKESVDRNKAAFVLADSCYCRSPQGERG